MNGAASLHRGTPVWCRSVLGLALPRSAGRVSTLVRERPVALSRGPHPPGSHCPAVSRGGSLPGGRTSRFLCRLRSHLLTGLAEHRRHGWLTARLPVVTSHRESAEPVCKMSSHEILNVRGPVGHSPTVCDTELTRFTPAVNAGIPPLNQDRHRCLLFSPNLYGGFWASLSPSNVSFV